MAGGNETGAGRAASGTEMWLVAVLIVFMSGIEGAIWALDVFGNAPRSVRATVLEHTAFWPGLLGGWKPNYPAQPAAMFVTYGFVHGGPVHLLVNMLTLWSLAVRMFERVGTGRFLAVYGASLIGGAAAFALLSAGVRPMVGASGALFGLAGAVLAWEASDRAAAAVSLWPVLKAVALLVGLNAVLWWAMAGLLAWQTHLGGFVAGWAVAALIGAERRGR